jgi:hypothetical protein
MNNDTSEIIFEVQVDNYPNRVGKIQLRYNNDNYRYLVVLCSDEKETIILDADRDQWGVYMGVSDSVIAVEDGTRSFIDGLILCLQKLKEKTEFETTQPTITIEEKEN